MTFAHKPRRGPRDLVPFSPEWFAQYVSKCANSKGCWLWNGSESKRGPAPKFFRHYHGPIPDGQIVLHKCDVPGCVNPDHLEAGTHAENMLQMVLRGRGKAGHDAAPYPTNEEIGGRIRSARMDAGLSQTELGNRLGNGYSTICKWERGHGSPSLASAVALSESLGVSLDWLARGLPAERKSA